GREHERINGVATRDEVAALIARGDGARARFGVCLIASGSLAKSRSRQSRTGIASHVLLRSVQNREPFVFVLTVQFLRTKVRTKDGPERRGIWTTRVALILGEIVAGIPADADSRHTGTYAIRILHDQRSSTGIGIVTVSVGPGRGRIQALQLYLRNGV